MVVIFVIENYNIYFRGIYILLLRKKIVYVLVILFVELFMEEFIIFSYKIKCLDGILDLKESWN